MWGVRLFLVFVGTLGLVKANESADQSLGNQVLEEISYDFPLRFSDNRMIFIVDKRDDGYSIAVHRDGELTSFSEYGVDWQRSMNIEKDGETVRYIIDSDGDGVPDLMREISKNSSEARTWHGEVAWTEVEPVVDPKSKANVGKESGNEGEENQTGEGHEISPK
ncbi:MAG: hypothetical protein ACQKBT_02230 [Puniceicoccales bacterium]